MQQKRCAIVGAGGSGIPTARWALEYGYETTVFEATDSIGGLWNFKPAETEFATVMKSTIINTSKEMTAYSDYPPPANFANYMHNTQLKKYICDYAKEFGVDKLVRFEHRVLNVERADDYEKTGRWRIDYTDANGNQKTETFDCVCVCTGHHAKPNWAIYPGQFKFKGRIVHSHSYKDHRGYEDKRVLIVGIGNSAMDVACELSRIARSVHLSTRRGAWILPRTGPNGRPSDFSSNRFFWWIRSNFPRYFAWSFQRRLNSIFDHDEYGVRPEHSISQQHPSLSDELPGKIAAGTVVVKGDIREFRPNSVLFQDRVEVDIDEVVMCTGYTFDFPYLEGGKLVPVKKNHVKLYKKMFPPATADHNTFAMIGLYQPLGSIMAIAEMQARVFFAVQKGEIRLPTKAAMSDECDQAEAAVWKRYVYSPRHTIQVDYITFMDELAEMIGARPRLLRYLFTDPKFFRQLLFGPTVPYQYRLVGPHALPAKSRKNIMEIERRRVAGIRNRNTGYRKEPIIGLRIRAMEDWICLFLIVCVFLYVILAIILVFVRVLS